MPSVTGRGTRLLLVWVVLAWAMAVHAAPPVPMRLSLLTTEGIHTPAQVLAGEAGEFAPTHDGRLLLAGGDRLTHWLRIETDLPVPPDPRNGPYVLWLDRVPVLELKLHIPHQGRFLSESRSFFSPSAGEPSLAGGYAFALPHDAQGRQVLLLEVRNRIALSMRPLIESEADYQDGDRRAAIALSAVYAGLLVLGTIALALFLALRDRMMLTSLAFVLSALAVLLAVNGHLYMLPLVDGLAHWRVLGIFALGHLGAAAALGLARQYADIAVAAASFDRVMRAGIVVSLAAVLLCLLNLQSHAMLYQAGSMALWGGAGAVCMASAAIAWRRGRPLALPVLALWGLLTVAVIVRGLVDIGWVPQNTLTMYGFQIVLAGSAFLLSMGLADRLMEFRKQRDRARLAKEQSDASLMVEQVRRRFVETLQSETRSARSGDLEWVVFRRLLEALHSLIPQQQGSAVVAFGYHGLDLLLTEPIPDKDRYSRLLAARSSTLRGVCRSRTPVQVMLEGDACAAPPGGGGESPAPQGGLFAVIPLQIAKPGWGALLIERAPWETFDPTEMRLAAEFAAMATSAADEAASAFDLRRKAEIDPLTGAYNRRAMDAHLERLVEAAFANRQHLSILFVDLDHFKQVNDRFGHSVGDDCLRLLADAIRREIGPDDLFGRFGGEEFILVLPNCGIDAAREMGERLRRAVADLVLEVGEAAVRFTISVGVSARAASEKSAQPIIERADRALYAAKRGGRNQVQVMPAPGVGMPSRPPSEYI